MLKLPIKICRPGTQEQGVYVAQSIELHVVEPPLSNTTRDIISIRLVRSVPNFTFRPTIGELQKVAGMDLDIS